MRQLRRHAFRKWLESKHARSVVGLPRRAQKCPIACYLREKGAPDPDVGALTWKEEFYKDPNKKTPAWAKRFIEKVDRTGVHGIAARRALKILDAI